MIELHFQHLSKTTRFGFNRTSKIDMDEREAASPVNGSPWPWEHWISGKMLQYASVSTEEWYSAAVEGSLDAQGPAGLELDMGPWGHGMFLFFGHGGLVSQEDKMSLGAIAGNSMVWEAAYKHKPSPLWEVSRVIWGSTLSISSAFGLDSCRLIVIKINRSLSVSSCPHSSPCFYFSW